MAASGTSGAGKSAKPHLLGSEAMGNASAYGVGGVHRHTPEITQNLSALTDDPVTRQLHARCSCPMSRGILATGSAPVREGVTAEDAYAVYAKAYADEPFVHLLPPGQWPQTQSVIGSNAVHLQVTVDEAAGRLVAVGAVDNLAKGTGRRGGAVHEPRPGPRGDPRPDHRRDRAVSGDDAEARRSDRDGAAPLAPSPEPLAVVRLRPGADLPAWAASSTAVLGHRDRRPRPRSSAPPAPCRARARHAGPVHRLLGRGPLDLTLVGVLAGLLAPLAEAGISVFTLSTFDTDWILVPASSADAAAEVWVSQGHAVEAGRPPDREDPVSITHPAGFRASGVRAGLKSTGARDLALVVNDGPRHDSASVFTANRCKANPVLWSQEVVKDGVVRAVFLNSGGANCYTGPEGFQTTHAVAERVAEHLGAAAGDVVVCSTGLIGLTNDRATVLAGLDAAHEALSPDGGDDAAHAIMTTDSVSKQVVVEAAGWSIGGMAKGAGMLAPQLATMLV